MIYDLKYRNFYFIGLVKNADLYCLPDTLGWSPWHVRLTGSNMLTCTLLGLVMFTFLKGLSRHLLMLTCRGTSSSTSLLNFYVAPLDCEVFLWSFHTKILGDLWNLPDGFTEEPLTLGKNHQFFNYFTSVKNSIYTLPAVLREGNGKSPSTNRSLLEIPGISDVRY